MTGELSTSGTDTRGADDILKPSGQFHDPNKAVVLTKLYTAIAANCSTQYSKFSFMDSVFLCSLYFILRLQIVYSQVCLVT